VLLRPLAYPEAERLHAVHEVVPKFAHIAPLVPVNAMHFAEWRRSSRSFDRMALVSGGSMTLTGDEPERIAVARVSPALFPMLGVQPALGRTLRSDEDTPGRDGVVLIDHQVWQRRYGGSRDILGRKVVLDGKPHEIVGVLPADFRFPKLSDLYAMTVSEDRPQIWRPFAVRPEELTPIGDFNYACIVSVRPEVTTAQAADELNAVQARITESLPERVELRAALVPLQQQITGRAQASLYVLLSAVAVVLLVGCVNIANLLLARVTGRRREIAIRTSVGASASRLVRQLLAETLLLSTLGGVLGVALAYVVVEIIRQAAPVDLPRLDEVGVDGRVLLFTMGLTVATGLLSGLLPAWRFARTDPHEAMQTSTRGAGDSVKSKRIRTTLVAAEVALSALCLGVGGLLLHSFIELLRVDPGFERQRVVTVDLQLPTTRYADEQHRVAFIRTVLDRVGALPGVAGVGVVNQLPLGGEGGNNLVAPEGFSGQVSDRPIADMRQVNEEYFKTIGIPLMSGRVFDDADGDHPVAVVSALTADRLWPGRDPVGRRMIVGDAKTADITVVGVVGDVHGVSLDKAPSLTVYVPYWQRFYRHPSIVVRTSGEPAPVSNAVRGVLRQVDPQIPIPAFQTMEERVAASVGHRRFQVRLVLMFGLAAALLASLGIYGVVSYSVAQRTGELGIRMALGAAPSRIRALVLGQSLRPVVIGLVVGLAASIGGGRLVSSLLFGVGPLDPPTLAGVAAVLCTVAIAATVAPVRRATRVDPVVALRNE
jgi:predicted permease